MSLFNYFSNSHQWFYVIWTLPSESFKRLTQNGKRVIMELMPTAEPLLVINEIHITYRLTEITHTVTDFEESSLIKNLSLGLTDISLCQRCPSRNILYKLDSCACAVGVGRANQSQFITERTRFYLLLSMVQSLQGASSREVVLGPGVKPLWHQLLVWSSEFGTVVVAILFFGFFFGGGGVRSEHIWTRGWISSFDLTENPKTCCGCNFLIVCIIVGFTLSGTITS